MAFLVFTLRPRPPLKKLFVYGHPTRNFGIASIGRKKILLYKIYVGKMFFLFIFKSPVFCLPGLPFKTFQKFATYLLLHFQPFDNSRRTFYFISKLSIIRDVPSISFKTFQKSATCLLFHLQPFEHS